MHDQIEEGSLDELTGLIEDAKYALVTTRSDTGVLHSRPLTTLDVDFDGTAWFLIESDSRVAQEVREQPMVNLAYALPDDDKFVSIVGTAEVRNDPARARELWNRWAETWFPGGPTSPDVGVLRVQANVAEYWTGADSMLDKAAALLKKDPSKMGRHAKIHFSDR